MGRIGITTTVPSEVIFAAGHTPVDLNNIFIGDEQPMRFLEQAEEVGYPRNICGWIKGLYSVAVEAGDLDAVVAVTQGDCSNTHALMETLELAGIKTIPFAYPFDRDYDLLKMQIEKLMAALGTNWDEVKRVQERMRPIRRKLAEIDRMTWQDNVVSGWNNHLYQVCSSDFNGDMDAFEAWVDELIAKSADAPERTDSIRLAYIGVPPIYTDLYSYLEKRGARVVFNEVQRQFAMPSDADDLVEQYRAYTYPYRVFDRLEDIKTELERRNIDGVIHYVQSFCYRQIEDMIFREKLDLPILTVEGDKPGKLDARTKLRLDSFLEMLE